MGVREYLSSCGIAFRANIDPQLRSLSGGDSNLEGRNLTAPDFMIEWPRGSGVWRELEVKSNQTYWNASFFRMLIPIHWHGYGKSNSLVLWTSTDVDSGTVNVHGFNYASRDMLPEMIVAKKTCVHNFQLREDVPVRDLATETEDAPTADAHRPYPLLRNGIWTLGGDAYVENG